MPLIRELLAAYRIPAVEVPDFEADDVIGTLSDLAARAGHEVLMVTPDKDYGQLVTEHVRMYRPMQGGGYEIWGEAEIREKFGLDSPAQVIDYLALLGDKVDNIPGCKGIGEKGAQKLLSEYGTVENLLAHASEIKGATGKKLIEGADDIRLSYYLATIRRDVPISYTAGDYARQERTRSGTPDSSRSWSSARSSPASSARLPPPPRRRSPSHPMTSSQDSRRPRKPRRLPPRMYHRCA